MQFKQVKQQTNQSCEMSILLHRAKHSSQILPQETRVNNVDFDTQIDNFGKQMLTSLSKLDSFYMKILPQLQKSSKKRLDSAKLHVLTNFLPQTANIFTQIYLPYIWHFATLKQNNNAVSVPRKTSFVCPLEISDGNNSQHLPTPLHVLVSCNSSSSYCHAPLQPNLTLDHYCYDHYARAEIATVEDDDIPILPLETDCIISCNFFHQFIWYQVHTIRQFVLPFHCCLFSPLFLLC